MTTPKVSVVTSCYNAADFLPEAIESILVQTFNDFEFILIDDGSTDDTLDVIKNYAAKDKRIVCVHKENTGLTNSLNQGLRMARGEWIARLDADDVALSHRIETQFNYVLSHREVILLGSGCIEIDYSGREIRQHHYPPQHHQLTTHLERGGSPFPHSTALYNRECVQRLGGYRNRLNGAEDMDLWLRMSTVGRIECVHEPLIWFRKHDASITATNSHLVVLFYAAIISHHLRMWGYPDPIELEDKQYREFLNWLQRRLAEEGVADAQDLWFKLRHDWYARKSDSLPKRSLTLTRSVVRTRHSLRLVRYRLFGSRLAIRLTREWIQSRHKENRLSGL